MSISQDKPNPGTNVPSGVSISTVFQNNAKSLKHYVSRIFGHSQDVDDLLQDVYIRVVEAEKSTIIETPKAFIYKVARNLALNEKKRAGQKLHAHLDEGELEQLLAGLSLEDSIEQEQRFLHFCNSVNKLPPQCRKVFILKKMHGLSNTDIAEALGISVSTVDKHLAKGLISCKNELQRLGHFSQAHNMQNRKIITGAQGHSASSPHSTTTAIPTAANAYPS